MASITDLDAMKVVAFRLQSDLYDDAKDRARQLGFTTFSQYIRSIINMDVRGTRIFDKTEKACGEDCGSIPEPLAEQSDPQGDPVPTE